VKETFTQQKNGLLEALFSERQSQPKLAHSI